MPPKKTQQQRKRQQQKQKQRQNIIAKRRQTLQRKKGPAHIVYQQVPVYQPDPQIEHLRQKLIGEIRTLIFEMDGEVDEDYIRDVQGYTLEELIEEKSGLIEEIHNPQESSESENEISPPNESEVENWSKENVKTICSTITKYLGIVCTTVFFVTAIINEYSVRAVFKEKDNQFRVFSVSLEKEDDNEYTATGAKLV